MYHSQPEFVRMMLDLGTVIDEPDEDGFPPLIAMLGGSEVALDADQQMGRLVLLPEAGADPDGRGINDYTPLHFATE